MVDVLVSVIVPVYRNPQWVKNALDSVINQSWKNLEIIVVVDGSPDGCDLLCDEFAEKDSRISVIHQQNSGVSSARNAALKVAKGDYVTFLDSDDVLDTDHISSMVDTAVKSSADIVSNRMYFYLDERNIRPFSQSDSVRYLSREEAVLFMHAEKEDFNGYLMNKLFRKKILKGVFFDPLIAIHEDMLFIWEAVLKCDVIVTQEKYTYHYLFHKTSSVNSYSPRYDTAVLAAEKMFAKMQEHFPKYESFARKTVLFALLSVANKRYEVGCLDAQAYRSIAQKVKKYHSPEAFSHIVGTDNRSSYCMLRLGRGIFLVWKKIMSFLKR